jgi:hypothetical protein
MAHRTTTQPQAQQSERNAEPGDVPVVYRTRDVARLVGLHVSTIRRLDARGLLSPARTWAGHRRYTKEDVARLRQLAGLA